MVLSRKASGKKFTSTDKAGELVDILGESQRKDGCDLTDVNLICADGTIPAHAVLLQAVSPLFQQALASQGDNYILNRTIILPDFSLDEMTKVIQLVYTGSVTASQEEADVIKANLAFLQIENLGNIVKKPNSAQSAVQQKILVNRRMKLNELAKPEIEKTEVKEASVDKKVAAVIPSTSTATLVNKRGRSEEDDKEGDEEVAKKKTKVVGTRDKKGKTANADASEDEWEEPDYKDQEWFDTESRKCQYCEKMHDGAAQASMCITGHQRLRCYFCFRVCKNTELLFDHFKRQHKPAGRENSLLCPYCEQTVPYKSVSCHVISLHLSDMKVGTPKNKFNGETPNPIVTNKATIVPYRPMVKRGIDDPKLKPGDDSKSKIDKKSVEDKKNSFKNLAKLGGRGKPVVRLPKLDLNSIKKVDCKDEDEELIRFVNLDVEIRRKGLNGKIWVWRVKKKSPIQEESSTPPTGPSSA